MANRAAVVAGLRVDIADEETRDPAYRDRAWLAQCREDLADTLAGQAS